MNQAVHIRSAVAAIGEEGRVRALRRPDVCERSWKSEVADEIVNKRLQQAMAQSLRMIRLAWIKTYGSTNAKGSP